MKSPKTKRRRSKKRSYSVAPWMIVVVGLMVMVAFSYFAFGVFDRTKFAENPTAAMTQRHQGRNQRPTTASRLGTLPANQNRQITLTPRNCGPDLPDFYDAAGRATLVWSDEKSYLVTIPLSVETAKFDDIKINAKDKDGNQKEITLNDAINAISKNKREAFISGTLTGGVDFDCDKLGKKIGPTPTPTPQPGQELKITFNLTEYPEGTSLTISHPAKATRRPGQQEEAPRIWDVTIPTDGFRANPEKYEVTISNDGSGSERRSSKNYPIKQLLGEEKWQEVIDGKPEIEVCLSEGAKPCSALGVWSMLGILGILVCLSLAGFLGWKAWKIKKSSAVSQPPKPKPFKIDNYGKGIVGGENTEYHLVGQGMLGVKQVYIGSSNVLKNIPDDENIWLTIKGDLSRSCDHVEVTFYFDGSNPRVEFLPVKTPAKATLRLDKINPPRPIAGQSTQVEIYGEGFDSSTKVSVDGTQIPFNRVSAKTLDAEIDEQLTRGRRQVYITAASQSGQDTLRIDLEESSQSESRESQMGVVVERQADFRREPGCPRIDSQSPETSVIPIVSSNYPEPKPPKRDFDPRALYQRLVAGERKIGEIYVGNKDSGASGAIVRVVLEEAPHQGVPFVLFEDSGTGFVFPNPVLGYNQASLMALFPDLSKEVYDRHVATIHWVPARKESGYWIAER